MLADLIAQSGPLINRSLSAAIAITALSFLLNFLFHGVRNRVNRTYVALLACVVITYVGDLGVSFVEGGVAAAEPWLRFQWLGIAYVPVVYTHLSDAILELTGLPSRGRRRRAVRITYAIATIFFLCVLFTDLVVRQPVAEPAPHFRPGPLFIVFFAYFVGAVIVSFWFIIRARNRTLTASTRRRMTYLLATYAAPALSVFPFLLISGQAVQSEVLFYTVLIVVDTVLLAMLIFMAYTLSFFGNTMPERLVKARMLKFLLRGPVVGIAALGVILWAPGAGEVLNLPGEAIMPVLTVLVILLLQWSFTIGWPLLERWIIYPGDDEVRRIQELEQRLLTGTDFAQLLDSILAAICDYLRVDTAFVASIKADGPQFERAIGLTEATLDLDNAGLPTPEDIDEEDGIYEWEGFWLIPLTVTEHRLTHTNGDGSEPNGLRVLGVLGVRAPEPAEDDEAEEEREAVLMALASRVAEVLDDRRLQSEVFAALEGILPEMDELRQLRGLAQYGGIVALMEEPSAEVLSDPDFSGKVKDALSDYWGGPRLTDENLMQLSIVRRALNTNEGNPQRAMRQVLKDAIENLRPEGQRSMTTGEWILYNILELRFIQGKKVREVAHRLAMSEADFYRKQRLAVETLSEIIANMERQQVTQDEPMADS